MKRTSMLPQITLVVVAISLAPVARAQNSAIPDPIPEPAKGPWTCSTNPNSCPHFASGPPPSNDSGLCVQITNVTR
jgi:hypothetical protein